MRSRQKSRSASEVTCSRPGLSCTAAWTLSPYSVSGRPNTATSATLKVGDAVDDDRYTGSAIDLKTAGRTALTLTGFVHTASDNLLKALPTLAGTAATAGAARLEFHYYVQGRAAFSQG